MQVNSLNPEVRPMPDDPVILDKPSAVVQVVSKTDPPKTVATTKDDSYKTEFVKVYQDAGVIGAAMLTLLVLCVIMGWFSLRLLKMYVTLTEQRDKMEALRLEYFNKLTEAIVEVNAAIKQVMADLHADHTTQNNILSNLSDKMKSLTDRLEVFLFGRPPGEDV